jgi:hypothetical protein
MKNLKTSFKRLFMRNAIHTSHNKPKLVCETVPLKGLASGLMEQVKKTTYF